MKPKHIFIEAERHDVGWRFFVPGCRHQVGDRGHSSLLEAEACARELKGERLPESTERLIGK